jgi:hypothetical protein
LKKIVPFFVFFALSFFTPFAVLAIEESLIPIDAVIVLDVSRSMRTADTDGISRDAMILFTDMLEEGRDRVGFVAYAGGVEHSLELRHDREIFVNQIEELDYASWTDHGVGLLEAVRILRDVHNEETRQGIIIFLTDGNMNVNPSGERTNELAQEDVDAAISAALEMNIPIHTIGLNADGNLAVEYINRISEATHGLSFETSDAENLPEIIAAFFEEMIAEPQTRIAEIQPPQIEIVETVEMIEPIEEKTVTKIFFDIREENVALNVISAAAGSLLFLSAILFIVKSFSPKRVFTGKLWLEVVDSESKNISAPRRLNLIEYGNRVTLAKLLEDPSPELSSVILVPSPSAPSHLPQLQIKCRNPAVKFTKDFMQQDISNGVSISTGTEATIEAMENIQIRMRYVA